MAQEVRVVGVGYTSPLTDPGERAAHVGGIEGCPDAGRENKLAVLPKWSGTEAFFDLAPAVSALCVYDRRR